MYMMVYPPIYKEGIGRKVYIQKIGSPTTWYIYIGLYVKMCFHIMTIENRDISMDKKKQHSAKSHSKNKSSIKSYKKLLVFVLT